MPTYEYVCEACGHEFELFQSFSDSAISECPECKGSVRKVFSNVGVVFKGSGFYKNDSRATPATPTSPAPAAKPATPSTD